MMVLNGLNVHRSKIILPHYTTWGWLMTLGMVLIQTMNIQIGITKLRQSMVILVRDLG